MKRLEYHISFHEEVDDSFEDLTESELSLVTKKINEVALKYLELAGFKVEDFKLEFDLKDGASIEEVHQET